MNRLIVMMAVFILPSGSYAESVPGSDPVWHGMIGARGAAQSGRSNQTLLSLQGNLSTMIDKSTWIVEGAMKSVVVKINGVKTEVADNWYSALTNKYKLSDKNFLYLRGAYVQDRILRLEPRIDAIGGYGFSVVPIEKLEIDFIPGILYRKETQANLKRTDDDWYWGAYEQLKYPLTAAWMLTHNVYYTHHKSQNDRWQYSGDVKLTGQMTKNIAFEFVFDFSVENVVPAGLAGKQRQTSAGLKFGF